MGSETWWGRIKNLLRRVAWLAGWQVYKYAGRQTYKHVSYGNSIRMAGPSPTFLDPLSDILRRVQHEHELEMSVLRKRGLFGERGQPLTQEEEAVAKRMDERVEWEKTHCPECGRPYD